MLPATGRMATEPRISSSKAQYDGNSKKGNPKTIARRNIIEYKDPGRYVPTIFLLYSWGGSLFGVPSTVPLTTLKQASNRPKRRHHD